MPTEKFWKTKLAALLHDPPNKCLNIAEHRETARLFQTAAGLFHGEKNQERNYDIDAVNAADCFTASADRFGFPQEKCTTDFQKMETGEFIHPLSSERHKLPVKKLLEKSGDVQGILQSAIGGIETDDPKTVLFLYWRRWMENAITSGKEYAREIALFPADTRIPDHSIWVHNAMTSALAGCAEGGKLRPALLLFQLGGVQDFIAQARSTRDLWSGSYLLSWLMAHAMKAVSDEVGPDAVVFPNLRGNGIFDALHKDSVYQVEFKHGDKHETLWQRILKEKDDAWTWAKTRSKNEKDDSSGSAQWLLTPTLPNRFLAVVPMERAEELATAAATAIHAELQQIGEAVWQWVKFEGEEAGCQGLDNWKLRWDAQLRAFPQISWAVQPWLEREECLKELEKLPINRKKKDSPLETLQNTLRLAEEWLPKKDARYYTDQNTKTRLKNSGIFWSAHYALVDAKLAARRNTNVFSAWENPWPEASVKDSLSGKEEIIGDEKFWNHLHEKYGEDGSGIKLFASGTHKYAAMNLIKRLWCRDDLVSILRERLGLEPNQFRKALGFDSVEEVANRNRRKGKYVAVLAMDGDEMGKWVSGEKTPQFLDQLSEPAKAYLEPILAKHGCPNLRRLLTPSYHLQFSEALANFATWLAAPIVETFGGELIYAGGDDVLAMLPADQAIPCAQTLRTVFRGEKPKNMADMPLNVSEDRNGFVEAGAGYPLMVPGTKADVSIGLAIGHFQAPLQMLVKEAQTAEQRAKKEYDRGAIAFSLYKRSGEIIQWGCKWNSAALLLMETLDRLSPSPKSDRHTPASQVPEVQNEGNAAAKARKWELSERFPHALSALLQPYQLHRPMNTNIVTIEHMHAIIQREVEHVISRQGKSLLDAAKKDAEAKQQLQCLQKEIATWLQECVNGEIEHEKDKSGVHQKDKSDDKSLSENKAVGRLRDFIQPFLTETFINRGPGGEK